MFKKKLALVMSIVMALGLFMTGCVKKEEVKEESASSDDVIKIGVFQPLTGANAAGGEMEAEGSIFANKIRNEVLGKKVELIVMDNKSDKVEAGNAVSRLIEKDNVNAIIGSWGSSLSMSAGGAIKDSGTPAVAASATNPLVTLNNDYYFRVCFIDTFQGKILAQLAYDKIGAKKAAIIQEVNSDYSIGLAKFFTDEFKKLTGDEESIVTVANYNTGDQDFSAQLTNIKAMNVDVIFAPGNFTESALLIKQARDLGIEAPFLGGDTWETPEFIQVGGSAVEGAMFTTAFSSEVPMNEKSEEFLKAYKAEYDREPSTFEALGYDAYMIILDAIERANSSDKEAIKAELAKTVDFMGVTGNISLDANGDAEKDVIIKTVKDGVFKYELTMEK